MSKFQEDYRKRYPTVCPYCQKDIYVTRSLGILTRMTLSGVGRCIYCEKYLTIKYDPQKETLEAINDIYAQRLNEPLKGERL